LATNDGLATTFFLALAETFSLDITTGFQAVLDVGTKTVTYEHDLTHPVIVFSTSQ
jgi:hypothetical protein